MFIAHLQHCRFGIFGASQVVLFMVVGNMLWNIVLGMSYTFYTIKYVNNVPFVAYLFMSNTAGGEMS